mmetsp:Transcript_19772/g.49358  ORF Transcript_19772/g.49358 Transcript_19772/m.49358 type:complete len:395 (-) Transcript_19772:1305-2489(-)
MVRGGRTAAPVPPPDPPPAAADSASPEGSPRAPQAPLSAEQRQRQLQLLREQVAALAAESAHGDDAADPDSAPPSPRAHTRDERRAAVTPPPPPDLRAHFDESYGARTCAPHRNHPDEVPAARQTDEEEASEDEQLDTPSAARLHTSISPASLADLLRGSERDLPLQHSPRNPFPRAPALQTRAGHYDPAAAGDSVHAKVHAALQRIPKDTALDLVKTELCTLVPVSSLLFDLDEFLEEAAQTAGSEEWLRGKDAEHLLRAALRQLRAARELNAERIGELRGATRRSSPQGGDRQYLVRPRSRYGRSHLSRRGPPLSLFPSSHGRSPHRLSGSRQRVRGPQRLGEELGVRASQRGTAPSRKRATAALAPPWSEQQRKQPRAPSSRLAFDRTPEH